MCSRNHCFDVARQGHVHLAPGRKAPETYDRPLMEARAGIVAQGFFAELIAWCQGHLTSESSRVVLDAGCGEGSFLANLCSRLPGLPLAVGIDLAPEGVRMAASRFKEQAWCVADLAAIPLCDDSVSTLLNILSPANYAEFSRVLRPGGLLVKAVPTSRHLREIREALGHATDFSNQRVADHLRTFFPEASSETLETRLPCPPENSETFLSMTPLARHATTLERQEFKRRCPEFVTVSLEVFWCVQPVKKEARSAT